jgi:hypothetical protein
MFKYGDLFTFLRFQVPVSSIKYTYVRAWNSRYQFDACELSKTGRLAQYKSLLYPNPHDHLQNWRMRIQRMATIGTKNAVQRFNVCAQHLGHTSVVYYPVLWHRHLLGKLLPNPITSLICLIKRKLWQLKWSSWNHISKCLGEARSHLNVYKPNECYNESKRRGMSYIQ